MVQACKGEKIVEFSPENVTDVNSKPTLTKKQYDASRIFPKCTSFFLVVKSQQMDRLRNANNDDIDGRVNNNCDEFLFSIPELPSVSVESSTTIEEIFTLMRKKCTKLSIQHSNLCYQNIPLDLKRELNSYDVTSNVMTIMKMVFRIPNGMIVQTSSLAFKICAKVNSQREKLNTTLYPLETVYFVKTQYLELIDDSQLQRNNVHLYRKAGILQELDRSIKAINGDNVSSSLFEIAFVLKIFSKAENWISPLNDLVRDGLLQFVDRMHTMHTMTHSAIGQRINSKNVNGKAVNKCQNGDETAKLLGIEIKIAELDQSSCFHRETHYKNEVFNYKQRVVFDWTIYQIIAFIQSLDACAEFSDIVIDHSTNGATNRHCLLIITNVDKLFEDVLNKEVLKDLCQKILDELKENTLPNRDSELWFETVDETKDNSKTVTML